MDDGIGKDVKERVAIHPRYEVTQICLNVQSFQCVINPSGHSSQFWFFLKEENLKTLFGEAQCAGHACHTPAYNQGPFVNRQLEFFKRFQEG